MFALGFLSSLLLGAGHASVAGAQSCHPSYEGACLPLNGPDVDCADGGGDGPLYVEGPIRVVGPDPYRLDRDYDGIACERR